MSVYLKDKDVEIIVEIIDGWPNNKKLTWQNLLLATQMRLGGRLYTRQAFARYLRIQRAFKLKKENLKTGPPPPPTKSIPLQKALERVERLKSENQRLKAENHSLLEQFARWAYNAHIRGLDLEYLDRPLPNIDRQKTEF